VGTVFVDLEIGRPYQPHQNLPIKHELERAGAKVYNAFYDDGGAIAAEVQRMFTGGYPLAFDGPTDAEDVVTLFPGLAARVARTALDRIIETRDTLAVPDLERVLSRLGDENPYRSSQLPLLSSWQYHQMTEWASDVASRPAARGTESKRPR
jgi:hypothetical protein